MTVWFVHFTPEGSESLGLELHSHRTVNREKRRTCTTLPSSLHSVHPNSPNRPTLFSNRHWMGRSPFCTVYMSFRRAIDVAPGAWVGNRLEPTDDPSTEELGLKLFIGPQVLQGKQLWRNIRSKWSMRETAFLLTWPLTTTRQPNRWNVKENGQHTIS